MNNLHNWLIYPWIENTDQVINAISLINSKDYTHETQL